jgi:hypothetical protein
VFFEMDPEYSDAWGLDNGTVGGSARLGEAASVVPSSGITSLHLVPASSPAVISSVVPRAVSPLDNYTSSILSESSKRVFQPTTPSSVDTSSTILDGIRALNQTVDGLLHKLLHQEQRLMPAPVPQPPQPPVIQIFNGGSGVPEIHSSSVDPALAGGVAALVLFLLFVLGVFLLRRFFPRRWETVRDATVRILRSAAVPIAWLLHQLGDLSHRFGTSSGSDTVRHLTSGSDTVRHLTIFPLFPWIVHKPVVTFVIG